MTVEWKQIAPGLIHRKEIWVIDLGHPIHLSITQWKDRGYAVSLNDCRIGDFVGSFNEARAIADKVLQAEIREVEAAILKAKIYLSSQHQKD
jgi:hypothetical protein